MENLNPNMNFLIDTNIVIPMEPASKMDLDVNTPLALEFHRLANKSGNNLFVHPVIDYDINRDLNKERADLRKALLNRYNKILSPPGLENLESSIVKNSPKGSNDWVDNHLLAAVYANCVDYLVTEDIGIHKKAKRIGLSSRILLLTEAISILKDLFDEFLSPPPAVELVYVYELDENDPMFDSLRNDYPGFNNWLNDCKREQRKAYVIRNYKKSYLSGICILKKEDSLPDGKNGKVLKLCTVKVSPEYEGNRYGELLFKAIFDFTKTAKTHNVCKRFCFLRKPIKLKTLLGKKIINGQPQSITRIGEGISWLQEQVKM